MPKLIRDKKLKSYLQTKHLFKFIIDFFKLVSFSSIFIFCYEFNSVARADNYGDYKNLKFYSYLDKSGKKIIDLVDRSQKVIFYPKENTPICKNKNYWGYVTGAYKDTDGFFKSYLVICSNKIIRYTNKNYKNNLTQKLQYFINGTLNHEALHSAQLCKARPNFKPFGINNGYFSKSVRDKVYGSEVYAKNTPEDDLLEMEAFYVEDKPYLVISYLREYCY